MKVTDWRKKNWRRAWWRGGLMAPGALYGANLNTNLVPDPSFENVSGVTCCYTATELNSWQDGTQHGLRVFVWTRIRQQRTVAWRESSSKFLDSIILPPMPTMALPISRRPGRFSQNLDVSAGPHGHSNREW